MKKLITTAVLALSVVSASAYEVGVLIGNDYSGSNRMFGGVTVSQPMNAFNATLGYQRTSVGADNQNRFSLTGGIDAVGIWKVTVAPTLGVAYLNNSASGNGLAATAGVELRMPVMNRVNAVVDYTYQIGQSRVSASDGSRLSLGLRYKF